MPEWVKEIAKAISGGLLAGLTAAGTALADGHITGPEWIGVAAAALGTAVAVYWVPNQPDAFTRKALAAFTAQERSRTGQPPTA